MRFATTRHGRCSREARQRCVVNDARHRVRVHRRGGRMTLTRRHDTPAADHAVIDCDIHNTVAAPDSAAPVPAGALARAPRAVRRRAATAAPTTRGQPERGAHRLLAAVRRRRPAPIWRSCASNCSTLWDIEYGILMPLLGAGAPAQPGVRRGAGQRDQRLADRRVAGAGAAPARLDRRRRTRTATWRRPRSTGSATDPALRPGAARSRARASRSAAASTGRSTRRPCATTCRSASTSARWAAGRSPAPAAPSFYIEDHAGHVARPSRPRSSAWSARASSSASRRSRSS